MTAMTVTSTILATAQGGTYLHVGVLSISLTNALIILAMIVVFVVALVAPFPGTKKSAQSPQDEAHSMPSQRGLQ